MTPKDRERLRKQRRLQRSWLPYFDHREEGWSSDCGYDPREGSEGHGWEAGSGDHWQRSSDSDPFLPSKMGCVALTLLLARRRAACSAVSDEDIVEAVVEMTRTATVTNSCFNHVKGISINVSIEAQLMQPNCS